MKSKNIWAFSALIILVIAAIVLAVVFGPRRTEAPAKPVGTSDDNQPVSDNFITITPKQVSVAGKSGIYKITGSYLQFPQASNTFNQQIARAFTSDVAQFKKASADDYEARKKIMSAADFKSYYSNNPVYTFDLTSTVVQSNKSTISVVFKESEYIGGAHPDTAIVTYNYDVTANKKIDVTDLISLATASAKSRTVLKSQLAAAANETELDDNTEQMLQNGTDPSNSDNFNQFTFVPGHITFYFGEYQVAPYVYGEQDVTIPYGIK